MDEIYDRLDSELASARKWECELNFVTNDDGCTIDLLQYTHHNPEMNEFVSNTNYPKNCSYQFDTATYRPDNSDAKNRDTVICNAICEAAINSGFTLSRKSKNNTRTKNYKRSIDFYCSRYFISDKRNTKIFSNDDLADGTNIQFASSHKRKSARPGGKKLPRKTESDLSEKREDSCELSFKIVVGNDDSYYIKRYRYKVNESSNKSCLHINHIKIPKEKRQYMTKHLREIDSKLISDCNKAGFTTQMTSS